MDPLTAWRGCGVGKDNMPARAPATKRGAARSDQQIIPFDASYRERFALVDAVTRRDAVRDALRSSSDTEREVIQLRVIDRRTYHEVAVSLGCSVGAARVRASRAHACLRGVLDTSRPTVSGVA